MKLGLGLGLGLGIPLLGALGVLLFLSLGRRVHHSRAELDAVQTQTTSNHGVQSWSHRWSKHRAAGELGTGTEYPSELPASHETYELQNSYVVDPETVLIGQKKTFA